MATWGASALAADGVDAPVAAETPSSMATSLSGDGAAAPVSGLIQELRDRIKNKEVTELRTTYNGRYGASLLFYPVDMSYYVALFHEGQFWRVVRLPSAKKSESLYADFVGQTHALADVEIRRIKLEAQKALMERQLAASEARLNAVQNDLAIQREQEQKLTQNQQAVREQAGMLETERNAARIRLNDVQGQIRSLEHQQTRAESELIRSIKPNTRKSNSKHR